MWIERPVNKQPATDHVWFRYRAPVTAVIAVITVIAHRKIPVLWHREGLIRPRQILLALRVATIGRFCRHHSLKTVTFRFFSIHIKKWRVNAQSVAGQTGQPLDVKRRTCLRILSNSRYVIRPEDKNVTSMGLNKIVSELVDKHLIACIDCAPRNDFTAM